MRGNAIVASLSFFPAPIHDLLGLKAFLKIFRETMGRFRSLSQNSSPVQHHPAIWRCSTGSRIAESPKGLKLARQVAQTGQLDLYRSGGNAITFR